jgi:LuxR family maltose regulon positive regulatory protein
MGAHVETQRARRFAIEAKYLWPRLDRVTLRPDAAEIFANALERRLTIVCAPAGYGKTTTTAAALDARGHRSVWYKLDVLDRDPLVFIAAMTRAVRRLHAGFGEELLRELESGPVPDIPPEALAARFCSECDHVVTEAEYIVLDDYHETMDAPAMDDVLGYLLDNCPRTLRFVVLSRYEPAFRLEKIRLDGNLARIPRDLLLFDAKQVAEILARRSGKSHDSEHVQHLLTLTEGWPASVVLAGMALAWMDVASLEVALSDPRLRGDVFSYLAEQVFQRQSPEVQRFLLRTCCLEHLHGELAERLVGESSAHRHLHFLARNHIFTFESSQQGSFRYHNLLRDFLRQRYVQDEGESAFKALQRETAAALEQCGDRPAAVELLLGANEVDLALAAIARGGENLLERLPYEQLAHWTRSSHAQMGGPHPWSLILAGVIATRDSRFQEALLHLREAEASLMGADDDSIYQVLSILEWAEFWAGDSSASMTTSRRALAYAKTDGQRLHTLLSLMSAAVDMRNWDAVASATAKVDDYLTGAQPEEASRAQALRAYAAYYQGDMHRARQLIRLCPQHGQTAAQRAAALNIEGMIETSLAEYALAARHLEQAAESALDLGHSLTLRMIADSQACLLAAQGDVRAALQSFEALGARSCETQEGWLQAFALCHQGTVLRRNGDMIGGLEPTRLAAELTQSQSDPYLALNVRANLAVSEGLLGHEGSADLDRIAETAKRGGLRFIELKASLLRSILAHLEGDRSEALRLLEECLPQQLELGHVNLVTQELSPRPELASLVLRRHRSNGLGPALIRALSHHWRFPEYSQTLRRLCQSQVGTWIDLVAAERDHKALGKRQTLHPERATPPSVLDDLTSRERQVLTLLESTNEEIAATLFITIPTVKSHITHILRKMGHTRRLGAILEYRRITEGSGPGSGELGQRLHPPR